MVFNFKTCTLSKEIHDDHVTLGLNFKVYGILLCHGIHTLCIRHQQRGGSICFSARRTEIPRMVCS